MNTYSAILQDFVPVGERFYVKSLRDEAGLLEVTLSGKTLVLNVQFGAALAYRKVDEGDALKALAEIESTSSPGMVLYGVSESRFTEWFCEQGYGVRKADSIAHVAIVAGDDIIDILCLEPPACALGPAIGQ